MLQKRQKVLARAPSTRDPKIIGFLHDAFRKGLAEPSFLATLDKLDMDLWYQNGENYRSYAMREVEEQKQVVQEFGLKQD